MNAYELADQVEMWGEDLLALNMKGGIPVIEGAKMLRQQADELTEAGGVIGVLREKASLQADYIAQLEKGLESSIAMNKAQAGRQVKELTDDEIADLIKEANDEIGFRHIRIFDFVKVFLKVLRKAQEK
jgi:hypothetical protein